MADSAVASFTAHAPEYNAQRRSLVPCYDRFYGTAVDALEYSNRPIRRVLDLGAGTGLLSAHVIDSYPDAELVLVDGSPEMLGQAERALGHRVTTVVCDLRDPLPQGPFDAVVSALAIHHLEHDEKRGLFLRCFDALDEGGVFVNAELVAGPTPFLDQTYLERHRRDAMALGATADHWTESLQRARHDRLARAADQLQWLRETGFSDVDCLMKEYRFAVLFGRRVTDVASPA
jgi:tRNA (cmo5U34)-methyltransferase